MHRRRALATVLFVDIVESTSRARALGDERWTALLGRFQAKADRRIREWGGRVSNTTGDGFLALFDEPASALHTAAAVREAATGLDLEIRAGLHLGEVQGEGPETGGIAVHIAARVLDQADPGEILVSATVRDAVEGSRFGFLDRGSHPLKGISGERRLFALREVPSSSSPTPTHWRPSRPATRAALVVLIVAVVAVLGLAAYERSNPPPLSGGGADVAVTQRQITFSGHARSPALSPDGRTVAYVDGGLDGERLVVHDLGSGSPRPIEGLDFRGFHPPRWSPDGLRLFVAGWTDRESRAYIVPRMGGEPRPVTAGRYAAWSPDGGRLASIMGGDQERRLVFTDVASGDTSAFPLRADIVNTWHLDWSPRGDRLAFWASLPDGRTSIQTVGLEGGNSRVVYTDERPLGAVRWAYDGQALLVMRSPGRVSSYSLGQSYDLVRVPLANGEAAGEPAELLTGLRSTAHVSLDTEGRRFVYARESARSNLLLVERSESSDSGPEIRPLTRGTAFYGWPSFSPDGSRVAVSRGAYDRSEIYVLSLSDGDERRLTFLEGFAHSPVWSPDGTRIAFGSTEGGRASLWVVPADGGSPRRLEAPEPGIDFNLAWAPSNWIFYQTPGNRNIRMFDPETGRAGILFTDDPGGWLFMPRPASDGERVLVQWNRPGAPGVYVVSLSGDAPRLVPGSGRTDWLLGWGPRGASIYGTRFGRPVGVERHRLGENGSEPVVEFECGEILLGVDMTFSDSGTERFVCTGGERRTDIWLAEGLDPSG